MPIAITSWPGLNTDESPNGAAINAEIAKLPQLVPHCALVTTEGLEGRPEEPEVLHFVTPAFRELGRRYAVVWLGLGAAPIPVYQPLLVQPKKE